MIFLNLRRANPSGFGSIVVATCAISGSPGALHGMTRTFSDIHEVAEALAAAGVADHRYSMPMTAVRSGYGSFLEISEAEADHLNLLQRNDG